MVEDEKKRYRPTKNYLEHLPPLNLSAFEVCILFLHALSLLIVFTVCKR